ncbi:MAG: RecX family transcriptional regulator [Bacteroidia bacterium]|nr:RecX family transcriptional regulator [Bacteroidia bacterium]
MNEGKFLTLEQAIKKLEYYCSYQERCHQDVENKLRSMKLSAGFKETVMLHLLENDFLNEERFAKAFARGKFRIKKWGKGRIEQELKTRNISEYNISSGLKEISESDYLKSFNELAKKRISQIKETNVYKKRKKLADYLLYRGWESDLVYNKVMELVKK